MICVQCCLYHYQHVLQTVDLSQLPERERWRLVIVFLKIINDIDNDHVTVLASSWPYAPYKEHDRGWGSGGIV